MIAAPATGEQNPAYSPAILNFTVNGNGTLCSLRFDSFDRKEARLSPE